MGTVETDPSIAGPATGGRTRRTAPVGLITAALRAPTPYSEIAAAVSYPTLPEIPSYVLRD